MQARMVLLFGASGQLGTALTRAYEDAHIVAFDHASLDIADSERVAQAVRDAAPDIIVNAAAFNAVERVGDDLESAYRANAFGPFHIARAAQAADIPFVHVSTDYVFDGEQGSYRESDIPHPVNPYGASKHAGEELVAIAHPRSYIVRTSAVFGHAKKEGKRNFVELILDKDRQGSEIRVVDDQRSVPTYAEDLALGIRTLLETDAPYGVYHLAGEGSATWAEFASEILRQSGSSREIIRISTEESGTAIQRPCSTVLLNEKAKALGIELPPWQEGLARYLAAS